MTTVRARSQSAPVQPSGVPVGGDDFVKEIVSGNDSPVPHSPGPKELPNNDLKTLNIVDGKMEEASGKMTASRSGDYSGQGYTPPEPTFGDKVARFFDNVRKWFVRNFTFSRSGKTTSGQKPVKEQIQPRFHETDPAVQRLLTRKPGTHDTRLLLDGLSRSSTFAPDSALASAIRASGPYQKLLESALDVLGKIHDERNQDVGNDFDIAEFRIGKKDRMILETLDAWDEGIRQSMEECGLTKLWGLDTRSG